MSFYPRRDHTGAPLQAYQPLYSGSPLNLAGNAPPPSEGAGRRINEWMQQQAEKERRRNSLTPEQKTGLEQKQGPLNSAAATDRESSLNLGILDPASYNQNAISNPLQGMSSFSALNLGGLSPSTYSGAASSGAAAAGGGSWWKSL